MKTMRLIDGLYVWPTPGGAYHAVSNSAATPLRRLLRNILRTSSTAALTSEKLQQWCEGDDTDQALEMVHRMQKLGWVQGFEKSFEAPDVPLEEALPPLLAGLSEEGKALLAEQQGFYLASHGFPHETAEELAALSADLMSVQDRHRKLLLNNQNVGSEAWAIVDSGGCGKLGFWPLYVGNHRFVLVVSGIPHFNQPDFVTLIWVLMLRYSPTLTL